MNRHDFDFHVEGHTAAEIERKATEIAERFYAGEPYRLFIQTEVMFYSFVEAGSPMCKATVSARQDGVT